MDENSNTNPNLDTGILLKIIRNIPDFAVFLLNCDEKIILAEGSEIKKLLSSKNKILNRSLWEIFDKKHCEKLSPLVHVAFQGTTISQELVVQKKYYYLQLIPLALKQGEENKSIMLIYENITEEKLSKMNLQSLKKKAEKATEAKSEFLARFSHEIRTPLNSVVGFADQLSKTSLNKQQKTFLQNIKISSDHILSVLNETISISRIEAGEISVETKQFFIKRIVDEIVEIEGLKAKEKGLKLLTNIPENLNRPLIGDSTSLKQILLNLVNNAIKFTEEGLVKISAKISREDKGQVDVRFSVIDSGIGIPESKLKSIFHSYEHNDPEITELYEGTGLGLTIVKKLVYLNHGDIDIESKPGQGSEFMITLTFRSSVEAKENIKDVQKIDPVILKNIKLLLADDDEMSCDLATLIFDDWEVDYDIVNNGTRALDLVRKNDYNVILLDIQMPDMSGLEVAERIREIYRDKEHKTIILAVTANVLEKDLKRYLELGIDNYLLKPYAEEDLFDKVVTYLYGENIHNGSNSQFMPDINGIGGGMVMGYNLSDLRKVAKNNDLFINEMLKKFISNAKKNVKLMNIYLGKKQWKDLGEIAHKMIPSFRHLHMDQIVEILEETEKLALHEKNYTEIGDKVKRLTFEIHSIVEALKKEF